MALRLVLCLQTNYMVSIMNFINPDLDEDDFIGPNKVDAGIRKCFIGDKWGDTTVAFTLPPSVRGSKQDWRSCQCPDTTKN